VRGEGRGYQPARTAHHRALPGLPVRARILTIVRKNTLIALVLLLAAIAIAGTLGVLRVYGFGN
jgi:hypothetical protein